MCSSDRQLSANSDFRGRIALSPLAGGIVFALSVLLVSGCSILWSSAPHKAEPVAEQPSEAGKSASAAPATAGGGNSVPDKLAEELQKLGPLWDQQTKEKLVEDLRQTDPSLWPAVIQQYKAVGSYRQNARQQGSAGQSAEHSAAEAPPTHAGGTAAAGQPSQLRASGHSGSLQEVASGTSQEVGNSADDKPGRLPSPGETILPPELAPRDQYVTTGYPPAGRLSEPLREPSDLASPRETSAAASEHPTQTPKQTGGGSDCSIGLPAEHFAPHGPWHAHLEAAARAAEAELGADFNASGSLGQIARLSLLYLVAGRREDALRMLPGSGSVAADYWRKQIYALAVWLDEQREPDGHRRAAETRLALDEAIARLGDAAPLVVRNLAFCTEVQSYGCYKPVASTDFAPQQEVLLYAEVENFTSEQTPRGFYTKLRSSYQIFDSRGQAVAEYDGTVTEDYCQNRRRDYFNCYHLRLPARIYAGKHTLRLTVEDMIGQKVGQSSIDFSIKEPTAEAAARRHPVR
jgi:hypothetical protein